MPIRFVFRDRSLDVVEAWRGYFVSHGDIFDSPADPWKPMSSGAARDIHYRMLA